MVGQYEEQVYAAVLGKVIGVYMGRPFEGWRKKDIEAKWGSIDRYVNDDCGKPLVVADDDISGTFTFVRALADSGLYAKTPDDFFGKTWLNYLLEGQTILWWGGMSLSTEHTAFLRLKQGLASPESGSMALNGKAVAEQIGAQIFIDAFGMVAPGNPTLAAELAAKAARVSHDGEAVYAAQVVAAMVSAAFVIKDMDAVLDAGVSVIPSDCLIAQIHRDVRAWAAADGDWRATFERIDAKYGYHIYGGNCHIVPNHAIMVMAWAYAKDDFFEAQRIINTAGWDTDCNAANVGSVSALVCGLDKICARYDFRTPFADRVIIPTAEGTHSVSDCMREALAIAAIGRKIMGAETLPQLKHGAYFHFSLPGALQGFMAENDVALSSVAAPDDFGSAFCMKAQCRGGARFAAPVMPMQESDAGSYSTTGTPLLYNGMTIRASLRQTAGQGSLRMFAALMGGGKDGVPERVYSEPIAFDPATNATEAAWTITGVPGANISYFGFEFAGAVAEFLVDWIDFGGAVEIAHDAWLPSAHHRDVFGWISSVDGARGKFSDDAENVMHIIANETRRFLVTGNRFWRDAHIACRFKIHAADAAGLVARYQGAERYYAAIFTKTTLRLVLRYYGETVLAEIPYTFPEDALVPFALDATGDRLRVFVDNECVIDVRDATLSDGGAGFVIERGLAGFREVTIRAEV